MVQLIAFIILIASIAGIAITLYRKVPVLSQLPKNGHHGIKKPKVIDSLEKKLKEKHFHFFQKQMLLHKLLSWLKIITLKIETKTDQLLHGIRKKAQELDQEIKKKK